MVFCGFAMNYMLRINLNLAVVAMVIPHLKSAASIECGAQNNLNQSAASPTISHHPANRVIIQLGENHLFPKTLTIINPQHTRYFLSCMYGFSEFIMLIKRGKLRVK